MKTVLPGSTYSADAATTRTICTVRTAGTAASPGSYLGHAAGVNVRLVDPFPGFPLWAGGSASMNCRVTKTGFLALAVVIAITGYLDEAFPKPPLQPATLQERTRMRMWMGICGVQPDARALFGLARVAALHGMPSDAATFAAGALELEPGHEGARKLLEILPPEAVAGAEMAEVGV